MIWHLHNRLTDGGPCKRAVACCLIRASDQAVTTNVASLTVSSHWP
jgi:hypothetical protein